MNDQPTMSRIKAIREYFFKDVPAGQVMQEIKKLTMEDREELAQGAAKELGVRLEDVKGAAA